MLATQGVRFTLIPFHRVPGHANGWVRVRWVISAAHAITATGHRAAVIGSTRMGIRLTTPMAANHDDDTGPAEPPVLLTPEEAARLLRVSAEHVRCLIRSGELPAINIAAGRRRPLYRIHRQAIDDFIRPSNSPTQAPPRPRRIPRSPVPDLFPGVK